jgi:hypothetical protein
MKQLDLAQRWIVAIGGVLTEMNGDKHATFGGGAWPEDSEASAGTLRESWGVRTTREAEERLESVLARGHRAAYEADGHGPARTIAAWDLGRAVSVAGWAYAAGLLDAEVAWAYMKRAAAEAQRTFGSWEEFGASYAAGRAHWLGENAAAGAAEDEDDEEEDEDDEDDDEDDDDDADDEDEAQDATVTVATLLAPGGAWTSLPWRTPIDAAPTPTDARPIVHVSPGDGTLARALRSAPSNARVVLAAGTYAGQLTIDDHVEIVAAPGAEVIITADASPVILVEDERGVVLRGLTIRGTGDEVDAIHADSGRLVLDGCAITATRHGLDLLSGSSEAAVRGCTFRGCGGGSILVESGYFAIERSTIDGGGAVGVQIAGEGEAVIDRCRITGSGGPGVSVAEEASAVMTELEIAGHAAACVQVAEDAAIELRGCDVHHGQQAGVLVLERAGALLRDCRIHDLPLSGLDVRETHRIAVLGGRFDAIGGSAVWLHDGARARLEDVELLNSGEDGLVVEDGSASLLGVRILGSGGCGVGVSGGGEAVMSQCLIADSADDGVYASGGTAVLDRCDVRAGQGAALAADDGGAITLLASTITGDERVDAGARIERRM